MSGWLAMLGLALAAALGLGFFLRGDKGALQFMGAALLLAVAGYQLAGQARPARRAQGRRPRGRSFPKPPSIRPATRRSAASTAPPCGSTWPRASSGAATI